MIIQVALLIVGTFAFTGAQTSPYKIVCAYDHKSYYREDSGKFLPADIEHALGQCTHLLYKSAKITAGEFKLKAIDTDLDTDKGNYKAITALKNRYPGLSILLSVGNWDDKGEDDEDPSEKYLALLRDPNSRGTFISSARAFVNKYNFNGIDLAWQFPRLRVQPRSTGGSIWHKFKKTFGAAKGSKDENADEHRAGFTALIKQMKLAFRPDSLLVSASVIPHTNYSLYWDLREVSPYLDFINVQAFDYLTPQDKISPNAADFPAPLYALPDRHSTFNVDSQIRYFLDNGAPANKLTLGIPTYGRSWKIEVDNKATGIPPMEANEKGAEGHLTKKRGIFSYAEVCSMYQNPNNHGTKGLLRRVVDSTNKYGTYAWRPEEGDREGLWVGFEEPATVRAKAEYAKKQRLAGVSIYDLGMDDFRGICAGERYPLLKAAKAGLV